MELAGSLEDEIRAAIDNAIVGDLTPVERFEASNLLLDNTNHMDSAMRRHA